MEERDDFYSGKLFRTLVVAALFSGAGSGAINLNKDTSDRFKGADFARQITTRDSAISTNKRDIEAVNRSHQDHMRHSAAYTQIIIQLRLDLNELAEEVHEHQRGGMHRQ